MCSFQAAVDDVAAGEMGEEFAPTGAPPTALLTAEDAKGQREQEVVAFC